LFSQLIKSQGGGLKQRAIKEGVVEKRLRTTGLYECWGQIPAGTRLIELRLHNI